MLEHWESPSLGEMMRIPPGTFLMGSPEGEKWRSDDEKQHSVTLTKGYWMMKHPVTQAQWQAVMGNNPSHFKSAGNEYCPVEQVSWDDIQEFIQKLNVRDNAQYRLPTEAEWEYAARGGQSFIYSGSNHIDEVAWYSVNSGDKTHPVCQKKPNGYGLYDMSGNVFEWGSDWYGDYSTSGRTFKADSLEDPQGNASGYSRVLRGGGWFNSPVGARVAFRTYDTPSDRYYDLGFRLVRTIT